MRQQRAKLISEARGIYDSCENRRIAPTAEQCGTFERLMDEADKLQDKYERRERLEAAERSLSSGQGRVTHYGQPGRRADATEQRTEAAFERYLRDGKDTLSADEFRALQADSNPAGGYLLAPQTMVSQLIKAVDDYLVIRQLATKFTLDSASSLGAAALDADPSDADWTNELSTGNEDSTMAFGKRELHPHPLAKRIKVSRTLLQRVPSAAAIVTQRLAYKLAVTQELAFMTGNGAGKPLGLFTASADGIPTSRDVSTGSATDVTADGLIDALYSLKEPYLRSGSLRWLFHRDAVKRIRKLKDTTGQYLWQPGLNGGQQDTVLGVPVIMSEYVPNTFTTGLYVGMVGDFSNYWIADALSLSIQRLEELYAETNQVGFITRSETDGMPVLAEAFARVKLA
jgi:HK97 family phage major capsid protein